MNNQLLRKSLLHLTRFKSRTIRIPREITLLKDEEIAPLIKYRTAFIQDAISKETLGDFPSSSRRLERFLKYHMIPVGKMLRPYLLIYTFKSIVDHYKINDSSQMEDAYRMAWCVEMFNCQAMVTDDIADNNDVRRGRIAWHKQEDIGMSALFDPPLVLFSMHKLLQKYFSQHPNYCKIIESFMHNMQYFVYETSHQDIKRLDDFIMDDYFKLARLKSTYYCISQPIELANLLAEGLFNFEIVQQVLLHFGFLTSAQNDMADAYPEVINEKPSTDIQGNKFSLPITIALRKASPLQKKILKECYGQNDTKKVKTVRQIYDELDVVSEYYKIESRVYEEIANDIKKIEDDFTRSLMGKIAYAYTFGEVGVPPF